MPDSLIEEATKRRDAALAEARRWDDFVNMYESLTTRPTRQPIQSSLLAVANTKHPLPNKPKSSGALAVTEEATISILREFGRPAKTSELLNLLVARGVEVGGQSPSATLSARLSRATSLINDRSTGWWFRNSTGGEKGWHPVPPADEESLGDSQAEPRA